MVSRMENHEQCDRRDVVLPFHLIYIPRYLLNDNIIIFNICGVQCRGRRQQQQPQLWYKTIYYNNNDYTIYRAAAAAGAGQRSARRRRDMRTRASDGKAASEGNHNMSHEVNQPAVFNVRTRHDRRLSCCWSIVTIL